MQADRYSGGATGCIKFNLDLNEEFNLTNQIHQLPCSIKYNGPCYVTDYFKPKLTEIEVDGLRLKEAYFRGRKLNGVSVPFPCGYCGFVLGKNNVCNEEDYDMPGENYNHWEMKAHSKNITCWNHNVLPSPDDVFLRFFHWFPVAEAIVSLFQGLHHNLKAELFVWRINTLVRSHPLVLDMDEIHHLPLE